jgi:tetratricopeptide (TPR) repeat protein
MTEHRARSKAERKQERAERIQHAWQERYDELVAGEVTLAELLGHSDEKLMRIAEAGLRLMQIRKYEQAYKVLAGLPLLDPYVPYFRLLLGCLLEKMQNPHQALEEYAEAIRLCESTEPRLAMLSHVLLAVAKLYLRNGQTADALGILRRLASDEFDPDGDLRTAREVRSILQHLENAAGQQAARGAPPAGRT